MMEASNLKVANALLLIFNQNNKRPSDMDIYNRCLAKKLKKVHIDHRMNKASPLSPYNRGSFLHGIADDISMTFVRAATVDPGTFCSTKTLFSLHSQGRVREKKLYDRFEADRAIKEAREAAIEEEERRVRKEKAEQAKKEALVQKLKEKEERRQMRAVANRLAEQQMMAAEEQHVYDAEVYLVEMEKQVKLEEELRIKREEEERIREAEEKAEREKMEKERVRKAEEAARRKKVAEEGRQKREEELRLKREAQAARKKKQQEERARKERLEEEEQERVRQAEKEAQLKREEDAALRKAAKEARRQKLQEEASLRKAAKEARTKELEQQARMEEERRAWKLREAARMEREHAKQQIKAKREEAARIKVAEEAAQQQAEAKAKAAAEAKKEKEQKKQEKLAAKLAAKEAAKVQTTPKKRGRPCKTQQVVNIRSPPADLSGSSGSPGTASAVPTSERSAVVSGDHIMFKFARDDCWQVGIVRHACAKSRGKQKQAKKSRKTARPKASDAHHWFNVFFAHNKSMLVLHLTPEGKGSDWLFVQDVSPVAWRTALKVGDELEMLDCQTQSQWVSGRVTHVDESAQMMTMQEGLTVTVTGAVTKSHIQNGCNFAPPHTFIAVAHIEDDHHSLCTKCGIGGDVLLCDSPGCPAVWHTHCADLAVIPEGDFVCPLHHQ